MSVSNNIGYEYSIGNDAREEDEVVFNSDSDSDYTDDDGDYTADYPKTKQAMKKVSDNKRYEDVKFERFLAHEAVESEYDRDGRVMKHIVYKVWVEKNPTVFKTTEHDDELVEIAMRLFYCDIHPAHLFSIHETESPIETLKDYVLFAGSEMMVVKHDIDTYIQHQRERIKRLTTIVTVSNRRRFMGKVIEDTKPFNWQKKKAEEAKKKEEEEAKKRSKYFLFGHKPKKTVPVVVEKKKKKTGTVVSDSVVQSRVDFTFTKRLEQLEDMMKPITPVSVEPFPENDIVVPLKATVDDGFTLVQSRKHRIKKVAIPTPSETKKEVSTREVVDDATLMALAPKKQEHIIFISVDLIKKSIRDTISIIRTAIEEDNMEDDLKELREKTKKLAEEKVKEDLLLKQQENEKKNKRDNDTQVLKDFVGHRTFKKILIKENKKKDLFEFKTSEDKKEKKETVEIKTQNTKQMICTSVIQKTYCRHGYYCRFAHSYSELSPSQCLCEEKLGYPCRDVQLLNGIYINTSKKFFCHRLHKAETPLNLYYRTSVFYPSLPVIQKPEAYVGKKAKFEHKTEHFPSTPFFKTNTPITFTLKFSYADMMKPIIPVSVAPFPENDIIVVSVEPFPENKEIVVRIEQESKTWATVPIISDTFSEKLLKLIGNSTPNTSNSNNDGFIVVDRKKTHTAPICNFFNSPRGCRFGIHCNNRHITITKPSIPCKYYRTTGCNNERCRFAHI